MDLPINDEENKKVVDMLFGGIGGAIAASIIAILANIYSRLLRTDVYNVFTQPESSAAV